MGDYTVNLLNILGQGSFGVVYIGKEKSSGKTVAVKQIKIKEGEQGILNIFNSYPKKCTFTNFCTLGYKVQIYHLIELCPI